MDGTRRIRRRGVGKVNATMKSMTTKPRLLILMFSRVDKEPRVFRQLMLLKDEYNLTTIGYGTPPLPEVPHISIPESIPEHVLVRKIYYALYLIAYRLRWYPLAYRLVALHRWAWRRLSQERWDVVIAHDVNTVPLANRLAPRLGVLADLHEYAPRQMDHIAEWVREVAPYNRWIVAHEVTKAAAVVTVSQGIVDEYEKQFGVVSSLVTNATSYVALSPSPVSSPIRLVHSGAAARARGLELMIEAVLKTTANVTLDLYFIPPDDDPDYYKMLLDLAAGDPRIVFRPAVAYSELVATLNTYDLGLSIITPSAFNHVWALPNKFFDFIQARLAIAVGPSPEMSRIVLEHDLGFVIEEFTSDALAKRLNSLTPEAVARWKSKTDASAYELSAERQAEVLGRVVRQLIEG